MEGLKQLQREEKATLGDIASRLLSEALRQRKERGKAARVALSWNAADMGAKVDIADKEALFRERSLSPKMARTNLRGLMNLPRVHLIGEEDDFTDHYEAATKGIVVRGNLVRDTHLAALLHQHGVNRLYSADTDFLKFRFLELVNPLEK